MIFGCPGDCGLSILLLPPGVILFCLGILTWILDYDWEKKQKNIDEREALRFKERKTIESFQAKTVPSLVLIRENSMTFLFLLVFIVIFVKDIATAPQSYDWEYLAYAFLGFLCLFLFLWLAVFPHKIYFEITEDGIVVMKKEFHPWGEVESIRTAGSNLQVIFKKKQIPFISKSRLLNFTLYDFGESLPKVLSLLRKYAPEKFRD